MDAKEQQQQQQQQQPTDTSPPSDDEGSADADEDANQNKKGGRRRINIEFIEDKSRRHITFSKRKAGIMKKAYELSTLTGTQILLLVASETGHVYTFATPKLQPLITKQEGKALIQECLNAPENLSHPDLGSPTSTLPPSTSQSAYDEDKKDFSRYGDLYRAPSPGKIPMPGPPLDYSQPSPMARYDHAQYLPMHPHAHPHPSHPHPSHPQQSQPPQQQQHPHAYPAYAPPQQQYWRQPPSQ